jgi:CRISPR system Cascade subunit CasD
MKDTVLSTRHYLADARFLVGLEGEDLTLLQTLENALKNPVWTLSLGRKSYPLTMPPYFPDGSIREGLMLEDALTLEPWRYVTSKEGEQREKSPQSLRLLLEDPSGESIFSDAPLHFETRRFGTRRVRIRTIASNTTIRQADYLSHTQGG